ncbi:hypothetical protein [Metabacillus iocasae]|uniref:Outer membrane biogenesis lipoprotein LolB n=1 Tax=Priestia iocasae TaxID=2291674 RepID=A0ABS2QZ22_9BACI|nr:hypothetical protein [Metabacillus iocasae]MBM7704745.1 outer membrane biogenesis lipoprotein LolB [Metabacillus iocasae]
MNKSLLVKLFGSLLAVMLVTACSGQTEDQEETPETEQQEEMETEEKEEETTE